MCLIGTVASSDVISIISTLGFPIVMCGLMAYYVKYMGDKNMEENKETSKRFTEELKSMRESHEEEISRITETVNNNTVALTRLCERLDINHESD